MHGPRPGLQRARRWSTSRRSGTHCNLQAPARIQSLDTGTFRSRRIPMLASAIVLLFSVSLWFVKQFDEPVW